MPNKYVRFQKQSRFQERIVCSGQVVDKMQIFFLLHHSKKKKSVTYFMFIILQSSYLEKEKKNISLQSTQTQFISSQVVFRFLFSQSNKNKFRFVIKIARFYSFNFEFMSKFTDKFSVIVATNEEKKM